MDGICIHCGEHNAGGSLHGVFDVAAGPADVSVAGFITGGLTAWVAGVGAGVSGATSLIADVSASG